MYNLFIRSIKANFEILQVVSHSIIKYSRTKACPRENTTKDFSDSRENAVKKRYPLKLIASVFVETLNGCPMPKSR